MRSLRIILIVISVSIVFLCSGLVSALNSNEASVSLFWSSQSFYVGSTVNVQITFNSSYAGQLEIYYIGIHFDWMSSDGFYGNDLTSSPAVVLSQGTYVSSTFSVEIPSNVTTGSHTYYVGVDGKDESTSTSFSWDSPTSTIQVSGAAQAAYNALKSQVESKLNSATNASYQSAEAKSLLKQAQTEYNLAISFADEENWSEALTSLGNTTNYLDQASAAEQAGGGLIQWNQGSLLFYLVIIAIVIIITISVIIMMIKRKRKQNNLLDILPPPPPPP